MKTNPLYPKRSIPACGEPMEESMACELTKSTDTNARCDRSCSGEQSVAPSGAGHGLLVLRSTEDKLQPIVFADATHQWAAGNRGEHGDWR